ncbi:uncharacterized protein LOC110401844 [Numida meleagris]|uniref:uncharacterized protein LOC110401844 n=1 Tax=Numida meleagris TaxID=8996 RepID=UPI000B3E3D96|nr:uncharacterized protein LOC110401844 [Numida meleagris]
MAELCRSAPKQRGGERRETEHRRSGDPGDTPRGALCSQPADHTARATAAPLPAAPPRGPAAAVRGAGRRGAAVRAEQKSEAGPSRHPARVVSAQPPLSLRSAVLRGTCFGMLSLPSQPWKCPLAFPSERAGRGLLLCPRQCQLRLVGLEAKAGGSWAAARSVTILRDSACEHWSLVFGRLQKSTVLLQTMPMAFGSCFADPTLLQTLVTRT